MFVWVKHWVNPVFREVFEKITGGELAKEIGNSYNVTLNVGSIVSCQQLLDEYDMRGTNHVIISPETFSKLERSVCQMAVYFVYCFRDYSRDLFLDFYFSLWK